jgi:hypothetical protein
MENSQKIPVLFILMEFAPVNTTGNFRSLKFIKYISQFNIQPIIVTFKEDEAAKYFNAKIDSELLKELPSDCIIYRIHCDDKRTFFIQKLADFTTIYFSVKDALAKRWAPYFYKEIGGIIEKHQPQAVVTSLPPYSSGLLGVQVSKKFNLPLVIDMRDLWAYFGSAPASSRLHHSIMVNEEKKVFSNASAVICVTPQMITTIQRTHPELKNDIFHLIPNGFDKELPSSSGFRFEGGKEMIVIGYVGAFYYEPERRDSVFKPWWKKRFHHMLEYIPVKQDWLYRSPYFFFKALQIFFEKYPVMKNKVRVEFVGKKPDWLDKMIEEFDLEKNILSHGFVSYQESLRLQQRFDLLLATSEKAIDDEHYCLPSKIFDYVGQDKPILGFVTPGIQKSFLEKSGLGIVCDPDESEKAAEIMYDLLMNGRTFKPDNNYLKQYRRPVLAENLSRVIKAVINNQEQLHSSSSADTTTSANTITTSA